MACLQHACHHKKKSSRVSLMSAIPSTEVPLFPTTLLHRDLFGAYLISQPKTKKKRKRKSSDVDLMTAFLKAISMPPSTWQHFIEWLNHYSDLIGAYLSQQKRQVGVRRYKKFLALVKVPLFPHNIKAKHIYVHLHILSWHVQPPATHQCSHQY